MKKKTATKKAPAKKLGRPRVKAKSNGHDSALDSHELEVITKGETFEIERTPPPFTLRLNEEKEKLFNKIERTLHVVRMGEAFIVEGKDKNLTKQYLSRMVSDSFFRFAAIPGSDRFRVYRFPISTAPERIKKSLENARGDINTLAPRTKSSEKLMEQRKAMKTKGLKPGNKKGRPSKLAKLEKELEEARKQDAQARKQHEEPATY